MLKQLIYRLGSEPKLSLKPSTVCAGRDIYCSWVLHPLQLTNHRLSNFSYRTILRSLGLPWYFC